MKTALITGASAGIGKALAEVMAAKGINIALVARRKEKLELLKSDLETKYNIQVHYISIDLAKVDAAIQLYNKIKNIGLDINYLINNAGFGGQGYFYERNWEDEAAMLQLNIVTLTQLTHLFLPEMIQRNEGRILNIASSAGLVPGGPLQSVYFATKAYVISFSRGIASELADTPISVTALCPGATRTEFEKVANLEKTNLFSGKTFSAETVAKDGYESMMNGELLKLTALTIGQKINMKVMPFVPKKIILEKVKELQQIN